MFGSRVYVGGLPYGVREPDLERFFEGYGRTGDILIENGYGFVEFEDYRDADDAAYELNGKELLGERVVVESLRGTGRSPYDPDDNDRYGGGKNKSNRSNPPYGPPLRTKYRVIVENLSNGVRWQELKNYMRQAGEVTYAAAHKQRCNEGIVEFASLFDMKTAIEKLDHTYLNGRRIRLVEVRRGGRCGSGCGARSVSVSSSSRSRSTSKSKSLSRSRSRSTKCDSRSRSRSNSERESRSRSHSKSRRDSRSCDSSDSIDIIKW